MKCACCDLVLPAGESLYFSEYGHVKEAIPVLMSEHGLEILKRSPCFCSKACLKRKLIDLAQAKKEIK